jgi:hypothetical protein
MLTGPQPFQALGSDLIGLASQAEPGSDQEVRQ